MVACVTDMVEFLIEFQHIPKAKEDGVGDQGEDDCDEFDFHPNALPSRPIKKPKKVTVNLRKVDNDGKETIESSDVTAFSKHFPMIYPWVRAKIFFTESLDDSSPKKLVEQGHFKVSEYSLNNQQGQVAINIFFTSICDLIQDRNRQVDGKLLQKGRIELGKYLTNTISSDECFLGKILFDISRKARRKSLEKSKFID